MSRRAVSAVVATGEVRINQPRPLRPVLISFEVRQQTADSKQPEEKRAENFRSRQIVFI